MTGNITKSGKPISFEEWKKTLLEEMKRDGADKILNRITEAERGVVFELLFHHVNGKYWAGAGEKDWKAFRSYVNALRRRALALASEIKQLGSTKIFCISLLTREAFLAREGNLFSWRQTMGARTNEFFANAAGALGWLCDYIDPVLAQGDGIWSLRKFGNLNLVLLSIYLKCLTGRWQDTTIATLVRMAYAAAGKKWQSENPESENPAAAISELHRRFRPYLQLAWLDRAVYPLDPQLPIPNNRRAPNFLKRYGDRDSLECAYASALKRRQVYNELCTTVETFVREMKAGRTKEVNNSLVGYMNARNVAEVNRWRDFNLFASKKQRRTRLPDQHKHCIDHRKTAA